MLPIGLSEYRVVGLANGSHDNKASCCTAKRHRFKKVITFSQKQVQTIDLPD